MKAHEKTNKQLLSEISFLEKQIKNCAKLESKLKRKEEQSKKFVAVLEEQVESRTAAERIINRQLRSEIEQRRQLDSELHKTNQFLENIVNGIEEQIILVSRDFKILWANKTFLNQFGCKIGDLAGKYCYEVTHNQKVPCQPPNDICPISAVLKSGKPGVEVHLHHGSKGEFFSEVSAYPIKDKKGEIVEFVHIARDITEQKKAEEALRELSLTDPLTGLFNRRGFLLLAQQQIKLAKRSKQNMSLLFIDLDNLKWINDTFGHQEGDFALLEVTNLLKLRFRESDIIARFGGDEFVVLAIEAGKQATDTLIAGLKNKLDEYNGKTKLRYPLSLSIGIAYCEKEQPCSIDELLAQADRSMYEQKHVKSSP